MSGIASIIQAMLSVSPQVTPMAGAGGGGGGGMRGIAPMGANVGMSSRQPRQPMPAQGAPAPGMPDISAAFMQQDPMQQPQPPGYAGSPMEGPPDPAQAYNPAQENMTGAADVALQRQYSEAKAEYDRLQKPQNEQEAWDFRAAMPEAQAKLDQATSNIQAFNQAQADKAGKARAAQVGQMAQSIGLKPEEIQALQDRAYADPKAAEEATKAMLAQGAVRDQRVFDQQEEFRNETDVAYALKRAVPDMDDVSARYLADTGQPFDQLVDAWRGEKNVIKEQAETALANQRRWRGIQDKSDNLAGMVKEVYQDAGIWTTGLGGTALEMIPGTPAKDLWAQADTIKANVAFLTMEQLKMASEQGATGLGQVQIKEFEALQNSLGSLQQAQSPEAFKRGLERVFVFNERARVIAEDPAKFDAMSDKEYYEWRDQFNEDTLNSIREDPATKLRKKYGLD